MSSSSRSPKLQFFAISCSPVTYRSIGSALSCTRVLNQYLSTVTFCFGLQYSSNLVNKTSILSRCVSSRFIALYTSRPFWPITYKKALHLSFSDFFCHTQFNVQFHGLSPLAPFFRQVRAVVGTEVQFWRRSQMFHYYRKINSTVLDPTLTSCDVIDSLDV